MTKHTGTTIFLPSPLSHLISQTLRRSTYPSESTKPRALLMEDFSLPIFFIIVQIFGSEASRWKFLFRKSCVTTLCDHIAWRIHSWYSSSTKQLSPLYRFRSYVNSQYYRWRSFADSSLFVFLKIPSYFLWKLTVFWKSFFVWHNLLTKYLYIAWQKHSRCRKPFFRKSCVTALRDNIAWRKHSRPSSSIVHRPASRF